MSKRFFARSISHFAKIFLSGNWAFGKQGPVVLARMTFRTILENNLTPMAKNNVTLLSFWLYFTSVVFQNEENLESPLKGFFDRNQNYNLFKYLWQFASLC